jgi:hypothetical protein
LRHYVAPSAYLVAMPERRPSRAMVHSPRKREHYRGARPSVGGGVVAPHRLTIRLSEGQWAALVEAARAMGLGHRGLAKAARILMLQGIERRGSGPRSK